MSQGEGKFSVFEFGPKVVEKKSRYRDEDRNRYILIYRNYLKLLANLLIILSLTPE